MSTPDLDAIQARWDAAQKTLANDPNIVSIMQLHRLSESANDVPALLALVRSQQAQIERVERVLSEKYKLWAAICGNTCSKDIVGVDHDAIADEVSAAIRAALTATEGA